MFKFCSIQVERGTGTLRGRWYGFLIVLEPGSDGLKESQRNIHEVNLLNEQLDPENDNFCVETNLPSPNNGRVYVDLLEGI